MFVPSVTHMGCFNTLPVPTSIGNQGEIMTPLQCAKACKDQDPTYKVVGLLYYRTCYCGTDTIDTVSDYHGCGAYCVPDRTLVCGNANAQTVYNIDTDTGRSCHGL